jgi:tight adherence protein B
VNPVIWLFAMLATLGISTFCLVVFGGPIVVRFFQDVWARYARWCGGELKVLHMPMTPGAFFGRHVLVVLGAMSLGLMMTTPSKTAMLMVVGALSPLVWFKQMRAQRQQKFNEQLDPGLQLMANSVLATQNLVDGFESLAKYGQPPLAQEADLFVKELRIGNSIDEAMANMAMRCKNRNVDSVITALAIGRRTGGNLPKVLENTAKVLRETMRIEGLIASKTAEGKASGLIMAALPIFFAIVMSVVDPEWMAPLYNDVIGNCILAAVLAMTVAGGMLIRKVSTIDV